MLLLIDSQNGPSISVYAGHRCVARRLTDMGSVLDALGDTSDASESLAEMAFTALNPPAPVFLVEDLTLDLGDTPWHDGGPR